MGWEDQEMVGLLPRLWVWVGTFGLFPGIIKEDSEAGECSGSLAAGTWTEPALR